MTREEAKRLRDIANKLDDHSYDIMDHTNREAHWFHWGANEIRKVIMDGGYNGIIDEKYKKVKTNWELREE